MYVYNKITQSPTFKNLFSSLFGGPQTRFNAKFEIADALSSGTPTQTPNATTLFIPTANGANVTIKINKQMLLPGFPIYNSNITVAKTILHECIHALLGIKGLNENLGMTIPGLNNSDVGILIDQYLANYPVLQADHNFIYNHMIPTMVQCLSEIKNLLISPANINTAESMSDTYIMNTVTNQHVPWNWNAFFKYLSLAGLQESECFIENIQNVPVENSFYNQYNNYSKSNFDKNSN